MLRHSDAGGIPIDRRQFAVMGMAAVVGGLTSSSWAMWPNLRVEFHPAPHDMPPGFYQAGLEDRLDELREQGICFRAVRLPPQRRQRRGYLTGVCLFALSEIPWAVAVAIAVFLMAQPQRRVRATLGKDRITLASLDDICNPPEEFGSSLLVH